MVYFCIVFNQINQTDVNSGQTNFKRLGIHFNSALAIPFSDSPQRRPKVRHSKLGLLLLYSQLARDCKRVVVCSLKLICLVNYHIGSQF